MGPNSFLGMWLSSASSTICWKQFFSTAWFWHPCWKSADWRYMGLFLDSQYFALAYMSILMPVPHRLNYCSFEVLKLESVSIPSLLFFPPRSFHLFWILRIFLWILGAVCQSVKRQLDFWEGWHWVRRSISYLNNACLSIYLDLSIPLTMCCSFSVQMRKKTHVWPWLLAQSS